jgi:hypothetical protein
LIGGGSNWMIVGVNLSFSLGFSLKKTLSMSILREREEHPMLYGLSMIGKKNSF